MAGDMVETEVIAEGQHVRLLRRGHWEFAERTSAHLAVNVVAVNDSNELVLVEQERIPVGKAVIELPAGLVGDDPGREEEGIMDTARRELLEETGYQAGEFTFLTEGPPSAGLTGERIAFFRASRLEKVGAGGGDEREDIQVHEIPVERVAAWAREEIRRGKLVDPKIYVALYFLQVRGE